MILRRIHAVWLLPAATFVAAILLDLLACDSNMAFIVASILCAATGILAGVIAQILVFPPGALASVPGALRYGAVAAGFAVFVMARRSIFAGVACGEVVMLAGKWWLG